MLYKIKNFEKKTPSAITFEEVDLACGEKINALSLTIGSDYASKRDRCRSGGVRSRAVAGRRRRAGGPVRTKTGQVFARP